MKKQILFFISFFIAVGINAQKKDNKLPVGISGIYPSLAYYNNEGECGTGAVVEWAGRIWVITYGPHLPNGSSDKLYEITSDLRQIIREESIGGTPANRLIHKESNQLFIGPYVIDSNGNVRVIPYSKAPGRFTGSARHLADPETKVYTATMEEGLYEIDVNTLDVKTIYQDGNVIRLQHAGKSDMYNELLPGAHGKGLYSGQGVVVYSNNGEDTVEALERFDVESGILAEWNGRDWTIVRRSQFTEVTGPGGIRGNVDPETDPIWAVGWDPKSVILGVREAADGWTFYRLPKASHSYDGAHGWNTEWPRIRNVGTENDPDYLMTMHGMFWRFPKTFTRSNSTGIRPRSAYLKVIGDFMRWNDRLVFGCDDSAEKEFLNKRKAKGNMSGTGQSNSNLWFTSPDQPDRLGPTDAAGAVWMNDTVKANTYSEPFMFNGWPIRSAWIKNEGDRDVIFTFETDKSGNNRWTVYNTMTVKPDQSVNLSFNANDKGEWIRVKADKNTIATVSFNYAASETRTEKPSDIFTGIETVDNGKNAGGLLFSPGNDKRILSVLTNEPETGKRYYELDDSLRLILKDDPKIVEEMELKVPLVHQDVFVDRGSVLVIDDSNRRWRLPLGDQAFTDLTNNRSVRICREVATERDLFNCHGTFYELPAENADGYAKIRPVSSHRFLIRDYASYRGMLVMTGINSEYEGNNPHIVVSDDKKTAVWVGVIDDLWKIGKPTGKGGPWVDAATTGNAPSDPYLFGFYDQRLLTLLHDNTEPVVFSVEMDPTGNGNWMKYADFTVKKGERFSHVFPENIQARWIRFSTNISVNNATAWLEYK